MLIIIDAYNLLKQRYPNEQISETTRKEFINLCVAYAKRKGHRLVTVFDGGSSTWPLKEEKQGVIIIYSGQKDTADEWIKNYSRGLQNPDNALLISSDRELNKWADKHEIDSIDSSIFYQFLENNKTKKNIIKNNIHAVKTIQAKQPELDELMLQINDNEVKLKDEVQEIRLKIKTKKRSKLERKLIKKIEKL